MDELQQEITSNIITEVFKQSLKGLSKAEKWFREKNKEYDPLGIAINRYSQKMDELYNEIRIYGMERPIPLRNIFVRVNILEKIPSRINMSLIELIQHFDSQARILGLLNGTISGLKVVNKYNKIIVLGKPGSGKSTFLKYTALQCLDGKYNEKLVPVFVTLKDFSESGKSLLEFIVDQFDICQFPDATAFIRRLLDKGKCIILLDGLDEVSEENKDIIISQLTDFSDKYINNNFIISCRIAAYNHWFKRYVDVEIADFNNEQINTFINNWFSNEPKTAESCSKKVLESPHIKELASIPLLLTLICLSYDSTLGFPQNRSELYKEGIDALLKKWDSTRRINRGEIYKYLSVRRKESMFSRIAAEFFEQNELFFNQQKLEKAIQNFIINLPNAKEETLDIDSEAILKAIEAQHGIFVERAKRIYSFSHLTFQEYFTAKYIVDNAEQGTLKALVRNHLTHDNWREVFILTAEMLDDSESFFKSIKSEIDTMAKDTSIQNAIDWIQSYIPKKTNYTPAFCRVLIALKYFEDLKDNILPLAKELVKIEPWYTKALESFSENRVIDLACDHIIKKADIKYNNQYSIKFKNYINANRILAACLNTECYLSKKTREKIIKELFC
ncbi:MAG: NACHT domain-containing protein [Candidatus Lokiarchaeota archaeon]|nr:NACHT domain-containing protein [Candidatus Lokiarchaeota archaeon]